MQIAEGKSDLQKYNFFNTFIPLQINEDFLRRVNTYTCYSERFDNVPVGEIIPYYIISIDSEEEKIIIEKVI